MLNVFITGTDINVGKTFISAGLAATMQSLNYATCVYKPIQTGALGKIGFMQSPDLLFIKNIDPFIKTYSTYLLKDFAAPVISAENENVIIDKNLIKGDFEELKKENDCVIVESTGGLMTPVGKDIFISDIVKILDIPIVIVIKPDYGTVNQTLLTINHAQSKGIKIRGVIINNYPEHDIDTNLRSIPRLVEEYSDAKILGVVKKFPDAKKVNPSDLITCILNGIDIESVFNVKISKLDVD